MIVKNVALLNITGKPLKAATDPETGVAEDLTLGRVLIEAAMTPTTDGKPRPALSQVARYELAVRLYKTAQDADFEISEELIKDLMPSLEAICAPITGGQVFLYLGVK